MKRTVLPTVRITESLHHRVLQYVHFTVTKIKRIREKLNLKIISIFLKKTAFVVFGMHISVQKKAHWYCRKHWLVKNET